MPNVAPAPVGALVCGSVDQAMHAYQNGKFIPGGKGKPPVMSFSNRAFSELATACALLVAKQIRSSHLIASGGIIDPESSDWDEQLPNLRMMIYPREALEIEGTGTDSVPTEYIEGAFEGIVPPKLIDDPFATISLSTYRTRM